MNAELEAALADWKQTERALLFPTGYAANLGLLTTVGGPECLIVSDELNHASIIDGCRLSRSHVEIARHNDIDHVSSPLRANTRARAVVVTDSVFSMDGDEAPVAALAEICAAHGALLVCNDAHVVFGPSPELPDDLDLARTVTLSKGLGALGGAVCGSSGLIDLLVNRARSFIFTTGLSPADAAAALAALQILREPEGTQLMTRLRHIIDRIAPGHPSPIIPIIVGLERDTLSASAALLERGYLVPAIRPPTVPAGTARLRIALSSAHSDAMIDGLVTSLDLAGLTPV